MFYIWQEFSKKVCKFMKVHNVKNSALALFIYDFVLQEKHFGKFDVWVKLNKNSQQCVLNFMKICFFFCKKEINRNKLTKKAEKMT